MNKEDLGDLIRTKRLNKLMTQKALAEKAGLSRSYLAEIEKGTYNISALLLFKIADSLDVDLNFFMKK
ncbi:MAG TPA: helix-turn-helix transcriptional regulator [Candidatus Avacidaminococcus intestinavium]|uniref:Helix-turn-helix transcriptional regulator n=1 Tax=Candidatus Avacidaminococcus intestinavium TaxID=2840684 RepID=A0A9D1SLL4_9FIRM|nr:helix-turn-helix transcriptional regulator [Candidatus Avacidaminococcus intestinavium]